MLRDKHLTIAILLQTFLRPISLTWVLTLFETALMALIPLLIGFAIDGLLKDDTTALMHLAVVVASLIGISIARRIYDTRVYGMIRVELCTQLVDRSDKLSVSKLNARLSMARELVGFLEEEVPTLMNSVVQLVISFAILFYFHPTLSYAAFCAAVVMVVFYSIFHRRFFKLNADHNHQSEKQVGLLGTNSPKRIYAHFNRLRHIEIRISDTEAWVYGTIFTVLLGFILFNLWYAATHMETTVGTIFSIISYSWEFVDAALVLPATLQGWSRLSEIMQRINADLPAVRN